MTKKRLLTFAAPPPNKCNICASVTQMHVRSSSVPGNRANTGSANGHSAYEIFALSGLQRCNSAAPAQCRARDDLALPAHAVAAGRLQLPPSADLFRVRRRGDRTFRAVGRRMDDLGATVALPALGYFRNRQRAADETDGRAMVSAVAVRTMARGQRALKRFSAALLPGATWIALQGVRIDNSRFDSNDRHR